MLGTSTLALKRLIAFFGIYSSSWVIRPSETNLQDILSWRHFSSFYGLITHKLNTTRRPSKKHLFIHIMFCFCLISLQESWCFILYAVEKCKCFWNWWNMTRECGLWCSFAYNIENPRRPECTRPLNVSTGRWRIASWAALGFGSWFFKSCECFKTLEARNRRCNNRILIHNWSCIDFTMLCVQATWRQIKHCSFAYTTRIIMIQSWLKSGRVPFKGNSAQEIKCFLLKRDFLYVNRSKGINWTCFHFSLLRYSMEEKTNTQKNILILSRQYHFSPAGNMIFCCSETSQGLCVSTHQKRL